MFEKVEHLSEKVSNIEDMLKNKLNQIEAYTKENLNLNEKIKNIEINF